MATRKQIGRASILNRLVGVVLVLALGPAGWAQEVSPALLQAARAAYEQQQQPQPGSLPPVQVDSKLLNKKVKVYCHDGRTFEGKLIELAPSYLSVRTPQGVKELSRSEVARVEQGRRSGKAWKGLAIAGVAIGTVALVWLIVASSD